MAAVSGFTHMVVGGFVDGGVRFVKERDVCMFGTLSVSSFLV